MDRIGQSRCPPPHADANGRDMLQAEANLCGPSRGDCESMARRRYQKPNPRREGQQWVIYYWDDEFVNGESRRKTKRHVLGPGNMGEREAEKESEQPTRLRI